MKCFRNDFKTTDFFFGNFDSSRETVTNSGLRILIDVLSKFPESLNRAVQPRKNKQMADAIRSHPFFLKTCMSVRCYLLLYTECIVGIRYYNEFCLGFAHVEKLTDEQKALPCLPLDENDFEPEHLINSPPKVEVRQYDPDDYEDFIGDLGRCPF